MAKCFHRVNFVLQLVLSSTNQSAFFRVKMSARKVRAWLFAYPPEQVEALALARHCGAQN